MGCPCEIQLYGDESRCSEVACLAIAEVLRIERKYSRYRADNITHAINEAGRLGGAFSVDAETAGLIDTAFRAYERSSGLFDITSGVLRQLWNGNTVTLPKQEEVARVLDRVGLQYVQWRNPILAFTTAGMEIDFGGIAKEYAADRAAYLCQSLGAGHCLIDLGGDIAIVGPNADGSPWRVGIRDPQGAQTAVAMMAATSGGIATSGDYERFWVIEGRKVAHILNPCTGWPVHGLASVTVAASTCLEAGILSTIALLKGADGANWLRDTGITSVTVDENGHVDGWGSGGPQLRNSAA
jgi:thiamine biosynthesis lipoprotein